MARLKRFTAACICALAFAIPGSAHIGSPDIYYEGAAGPYQLNVTIQMPQTVPGIATLAIRSQTPGIRQLRFAPMALSVSKKLSPTPDVATVSPGDPNFFTGHVWIMEPSGFEIHLQADGALGHGELGVPGTAVAQSILPMQRPLGIILFLLMIFLSVGLVTIVAVSVREAQLEPGIEPSPADVLRKRIAIVVGSVIVLGILVAGDLWWRSEATVEAAKTQPFHVIPSLSNGNRLILNLPDQTVRTRFNQLIPLTRFFAVGSLIPDHEHLMHLFLIRTPAMDQFWHLHPEPGNGGWFTTNLPSLPAGHYKVFADVVRRTGAAPTLIGDVDLPDVQGATLGPDDSGGAAPAVSQQASTTAVSTLPDRMRMVWDRGSEPLKSRTYTVFRFHVEDSSGHTVTDLEPYMGMAGHAEFLRHDLSTFAHVHPMGDVSMAAVQLTQTGYSPASHAPNAPAMNDMGDMPMHEAAVPAEVTFPYGFPGPGQYRIFVQVKRDGRILSGAFDTTVE